MGRILLVDKGAPRKHKRCKIHCMEMMSNPGRVHGQVPAVQRRRNGVMNQPGKGVGDRLETALNGIRIL